MSWLFGIGGALRRGGGWLLSHPVVAIGFLFALHVAAHQFWIDPRLRAARDEARSGRAAEQAAHAATIENYRLAAETARRDAHANVARVRAAQDNATKEIVDEFQARLAYARDRAARLERVHADSRPTAAGGSAGGAYLSSTGTASRRADEAAGEDRLPAAGELTVGDALIATEQALQLDALIDWVRAQSAIDSNPPEMR